MFVCDWLTESWLANFTDVTLVSEDTDDPDDPDNPDAYLILVTDTTDGVCVKIFCPV